MPVAPSFLFYNNFPTSEEMSMGIQPAALFQIVGCSFTPKYILKRQLSKQH